MISGKASHLPSVESPLDPQAFPIDVFQLLQALHKCSGMRMRGVARQFLRGQIAPAAAQPPAADHECTMRSSCYSARAGTSI